MNTGNSISAMKTALRSIAISASTDVKHLYGFGSFFRGETTFNDIDIIFVFVDASDLVNRYYRVRDLLASIEIEYAVNFDITPLTPDEFAGRPLRDMHTLVPIW